MCRDIVSSLLFSKLQTSVSSLPLSSSFFSVFQWLVNSFYFIISSSMRYPGCYIYIYIYIYICCIYIIFIILHYIIYIILYIYVYIYIYKLTSHFSMQFLVLSAMKYVSANSEWINLKEIYSRCNNFDGRHSIWRLNYYCECSTDKASGIK